ncbi:hypothetical protein GGP41_007938 [Bipolaris sorokiniana]|uniref:DUF1996 domain-containing protein n=1 Tax=Cochliobolus sativus TaxID=45130 RepID=A0A8H6DYL4_COCSA|nr:hypothetical protein GGP41_007938 [Bipolaris sorokiniana]
MDPSSFDPAAQSTCTSCIYNHSIILTAHLNSYREDRSNYWTASVYFKSPENGTYRKVPQMANGRRNGTLLEQDGGLTIYYMRPFSGTNKNTTAMIPGFRMLAGDPTNRSKEGTYPGICHRCLQVDERIMGGAGAPCSGNDTASFPSTPCPGGIRATVIFPSCWDGVTLDSPDHRSHVAYAPGFNGLAGDFCPSSHPVRIPQVMYEIMFDTSGFADPKYYQDGKQPLVYSFGDATGYGAHGDYMFGWEGDALQRGMNALGNQCGSEDCTSTFTIQDGRDAIACTKAQQAVEDTGTDAWLDELPGGVQITE